ncbi:MAG: hypothetical protein K1060chlam5_01239 [Candidatus Anoxychlamydiales bacterium]|nr:hypothetical protein [Candidatus Anoxychlamydiales bacterium]
MKKAFLILLFLPIIFYAKQFDYDQEGINYSKFKLITGNSNPYLFEKVANCINSG